MEKGDFRWTSFGSKMIRTPEIVFGFPFGFPLRPELLVQQMLVRSDRRYVRILRAANQAFGRPPTPVSPVLDGHGPRLGQAAMWVVKTWDVPINFRLDPQ